MLSKIKDRLSKIMPRKIPKLPKPSVDPPDYTDVIGGFWGNHIDWHVFEWNDPTVPGKFRVWGHKPYNQRLKVGDTILSEGKISMMWFIITNIDYVSNPSDMFFADCSLLHQRAKPYNPEAELLKRSIEAGQ